MKRIVVSLLAVLSAVVLSVLAPSVAGAGGWAVASLDPLGPVRAGEQVDVGFRLLQHGRTPVVAYEWEGSTIGLAVRSSGREWFVQAVPTGDAGHYVATIDVPSDAEALAVAVQMRDGLFIEEHWADVTVQASAAGSHGDGGGVPSWVVALSGLVAATCGATIVADVRSTRRRRDQVTTTVPS